MGKMKMKNKWVAGFCLLLVCSCSTQKKLPATRQYQGTDTLSVHRLDSFELKRLWNLNGHTTVNYEQLTFSKPDSCGKQYIKTLSRATAGINREITASDTVRRQRELTVSENKNRIASEQTKDFIKDKCSFSIWLLVAIVLIGCLWKKK